MHSELDSSLHIFRVQSSPSQTVAAARLAELPLPISARIPSLYLGLSFRQGSSRKHLNFGRLTSFTQYNTRQTLTSKSSTDTRMYMKW